MNIHTATFILENGYPIRRLYLNLDDFQVLDHYHYNELQELTIAVTFVDQIKSEEEGPCDPYQKQVHSTKWITRNVILPGHSVYAADLIKRNYGLQSLRIVHDSEIDAVWMNITSDYVEPFLKVIASHSSLTSIKISVELTCVAFAKFLCNIPQQLQELELASNVKNVSCHESCSTHSRAIELNPTAFGLRRLVFEGEMPCFIDRTLIPLLRCCPELQELTLPFIRRLDARHFNIYELAQVLDSNCHALHTLHHGYPPNWWKRFKCDPAAVELMNALLTSFSRGFRQLTVYNLYCYGANFVSLLDAHQILKSVTFNTLEVLILSPGYGKSDEVLGILTHCPRLREFRVDRRTGGDNSVSVMDFWQSMRTPSWSCWNTLQVLELEINDHGAGLIDLFHEGGSGWAMAQTARTVCSRLTLLPSLKSVCVFWWLTPRNGDPARWVTWERTSSGLLVREENTVVGEVGLFDLWTAASQCLLD
ncbi:MAG: hypothetical protein J3Q66DRAFT_384101 [Benniella sp.]|nr:MAG: hypothetical protein J3Q66DRAFT_384101 [Benniella sp.]